MSNCKYITQARQVFLIQEEFSKFVQGTSELWDKTFLTSRLYYAKCDLWTHSIGIAWSFSEMQNIKLILDLINQNLSFINSPIIYMHIKVRGAQLDYEGIERDTFSSHPTSSILPP